MWRKEEDAKDIKEIVFNAAKAIDKYQKYGDRLKSKLLKIIEMTKERDLELKGLRGEIEQIDISEESNENNDVHYYKIIKNYWRLQAWD